MAVQSPKMEPPAPIDGPAGAAPPVALVVLGMHRSGTSALAGVLARLGYALPRKVMPANDFNPRGFYKSLGAYVLNDALLAREGGGWSDWQALPLSWLDTPAAETELARGVQVLQREFGDAPRFVLKDPRICRMLPYWRRVFADAGVAPVYLHTHRSPMEVARSLHRREGWPIEAGLVLWLRYELEAEAGTRGQPRAFTSYDRLLQDWRGALTELSRQAGLDLPPLTPTQDAEIDSFLTDDLRHSTEPLAAGTEAPGGRIRDWFRQSHEILRRWAESGETAEDYPELDRIRGEFDAAAALFHAARVALSDAVTGGSSRDSGALEIAEEMPAPADAKAAFETALKTAQTLGAAPQDEADRAVLYAQMQKSLRLMQIAQTRAHEAELTAVLSSHRRQAQARLEQAEARQDALEAQRDQAQALVAHRDAEITRLRADLGHQTRICEDLSQQQNALLGSTSWRLTAPLRRIVTALRR